MKKNNCLLFLSMLGWKPKWGKERKIPLTTTAQAILDALPKVQTVGYMKNNPSAFPAHFIFGVPDDKIKGVWRRVDDIDKSWAGLLKAAGLEFCGPESFVRHDLRRTWNVEKKDFGGIDDLLRAQQLGHSQKVNQNHYSGHFNEETEKFLANLRSSQGDNLLRFIKRSKVESSKDEISEVLPTFSPTLF